MDFSDQWKSLWSISSVFPAPLLLSPSSSITGPLRFHPSPSPPTLVFSSPSLAPPLPLSLHPSLFRRSLYCLLESNKTDFLPSSLTNIISLPPQPQPQLQLQPDTPPISRNFLHAIRRPNSDLILFFPAGPNHDGLGYVVFSPTKHHLWFDKDADAFKSQPTTLNHRILCISAVDAAASFSNHAPAGNLVTEGFLFCWTLYSIHWFKVESRALDSNSGGLGRPLLLHLASAEFKACISHACWNPHLQEECALLLDTGELRLFDLGPCFGASRRIPVKLRGMRIKFPKDDSISGQAAWLACEFSWHPRILILACSTRVFLVDFRSEENSVTLVAKIELSDSFQFHSLETDCFIAFCKSSFDDFYFSVATKHNLLLFDIRQPLMPVLKWDHNLNNPCYVNMYRLSQLRPSTQDGAFRGASESGFAILAGSLWNCEFNIFCYGPPISAPGTSVASKISQLCNSLYAWDLPSAISLMGSRCRCGNCLLRSDFSNAMLPVGVYWQMKRDLMFGFLILPEDVRMPISQQNAPESNGLGGFTLIRLMASGKLELQRYQASGDFVNIKCENKESSLHSVDPLLYSRDQEENTAARSYHLKLDYLYGFLNKNLPELLASKRRKSGESHSGTEQGGTPATFNNARELIHNRLKIAGINPIGLPPSTADILSSISFPTVVREIASSRLWGGMQLDLLQMAFLKRSDLLMAYTDKCLEFLDVPTFQMPPFFLREPSRRSESETCKKKESNAFVGPVLPLPVLHSLSQICMTGRISASAAETGCFSVEKELSNYCNDVVNVANSLCAQEEIHAVSLSCDNDKCFASQEKLCQKEFFIYEPKAPLDAITNSNEKKSTGEFSANKEPNQENLVLMPQLIPGSSIKDESFTTFVAQAEHGSPFTSDRQDKIGREMFDDLSPVQLNFDSLSKNFGLQEIKVYKSLKRQFSRWQESFKPYKDFTSNKIPKIS
ncbi:hypothetical protein ACLOJK_010067 [Asimina triloba]